MAADELGSLLRPDTLDVPITQVDVRATYALIKPHIRVTPTVRWPSQAVPPR